MNCEIGTSSILDDNLQLVYWMVAFNNPTYLYIIEYFYFKYYSGGDAYRILMGWYSTSVCRPCLLLLDGSEILKMDKKWRHHKFTFGKLVGLTCVPGQPNQIGRVGLWCHSADEERNNRFKKLFFNYFSMLRCK